MGSTRERIFTLLRGRGEATRQEIAAALALSMPTTLQSVSELVGSGLLEECGAAESSGGRKAKKLRIRREAGCAVGIDIGLRAVTIVAADLLSGVRCQKKLPTTFRDHAEWYAALGGAVSAFLQENRIDPGMVLGAGLSFPGILDGRQILRSHIFGIDHISLDRFRRCIPFPLTAANDANCACFADRAGRGDHVFLSLNESVGGAVMCGGKLVAGNGFQAGEIGHMVLVPDGEPCYCGKRGCADAYLSPRALAENGALPDFFRHAREGDGAARARLDGYLGWLALLLTNLRMLLDLDLVIGGQVSAHLGPWLPALFEKMERLDRFARDIDYVSLSRRQDDACAVGAAELALEAFGVRALSERGKE